MDMPQAIISGLRESVKDFSTTVTGVSSKDVLELMLITQYFDMLRDVGASDKSNIVFTSSAEGMGLGGLGGDMGTDMRRAVMEAGAAQVMAR